MPSPTPYTSSDISVVDTIWLLWSILLAISCWSSLALSRNRLWIAVSCLFMSFLVPIFSHLLQKKEHIEIVALPPYQFLTIATHTDCITYISQTKKNPSHHTWQRWVTNVACQPTILILAQQDLWRESHAIRLHTNPRLTAVYSPEKTFSTRPCESSNEKNTRLTCTITANVCQCKWKTKKNTVHIGPKGLQIQNASSPSATSIQASTHPIEITPEDYN